MPSSWNSTPLDYFAFGSFKGRVGNSTLQVLDLNLGQHT